VLFDPAFGSPTTHLALGTLPGMDPSLTRASLQRFAHEVRDRRWSWHPLWISGSFAYQTRSHRRVSLPNSAVALAV